MYTVCQKTFYVVNWYIKGLKGEKNGKKMMLVKLTPAPRFPKHWSQLYVENVPIQCYSSIYQSRLLLKRLYLKVLASLGLLLNKRLVTGLP